MNLTIQQLIALLPLVILGFTVIVVMLCIAWRRNHCLHATITVIGLNLSLLSLFVVAYNGAMDVTQLIRVDSFSIFYTGLVLLSSIATSLVAYAWLASYPGNRDEFYILVLIASIGGILLTSACHFAALFLGIELISLPLFGMIGYQFRLQRSLALEASLKYTLLSGIASSFLLFGMALVYADTGKLSFAGIGYTINNIQLQLPHLLLAGLGMMIVGLGFKLSLVPFHLWTPDVYQGAPAPVSIFLTTASKISIMAVVMRLLLYVPVTNNARVQLVLTIIALCSILFGNLMAMSQINIKRVLGYSSIAHLGYLLIGLITITTNPLALETIGIYLTGYLLANLSAFGVVSLMSSNSSSGKEVDVLFSYRGLFWHKPFLALVLTLMMLSLAGIPMTLGFIGKFYLMLLSIQTHMWWLYSSAIVVGSTIGLFAYLRIIASLYLAPPAHWHGNTQSNCGVKVGDMVVFLSALLVLLLGLYPQPMIHLIQHSVS